jgi:hypothetical protein
MRIPTGGIPQPSPPERRDEADEEAEALGRTYEQLRKQEATHRLQEQEHSRAQQRVSEALRAAARRYRRRADLRRAGEHEVLARRERFLKGLQLTQAGAAAKEAHRRQEHALAGLSFDVKQMGTRLASLAGEQRAAAIAPPVVTYRRV